MRPPETHVIEGESLTLRQITDRVARIRRKLHVLSHEQVRYRIKCGARTWNELTCDRRVVEAPTQDSRVQCRRLHGKLSDLPTSVYVWQCGKGSMHVWLRRAWAPGYVLAGKFNERVSLKDFTDAIFAAARGEIPQHSRTPIRKEAPRDDRQETRA